MADKRAIGVFDSGVGGLSVLKHLVRLLPDERFVYLGDTARVPYGNRSPDTVKQYSKECISFLLSHDVKFIVVACNTASALALEEIRDLSPVPVIGVIEPAVTRSLSSTRNGKIGVIATRGTVLSEAYQKSIKAMDKTQSVQVFAQACPLFVPLVEEGLVSHPATQLIAHEYLSQLAEDRIDTLILGCTHYPMLLPVLQLELPSVTLIDSGEVTAECVASELRRLSATSDQELSIDFKPDISFFTTDSTTNFVPVAERFLGWSIHKPQKVSLENFSARDRTADLSLTLN